MSILTTLDNRPAKGNYGPHREQKRGSHEEKGGGRKKRRRLASFVILFNRLAQFGVEEREKKKKGSPERGGGGNGEKEHVRTGANTNAVQFVSTPSLGAMPEPASCGGRGKGEKFSLEKGGGVEGEGEGEGWRPACFLPAPCVNRESAGARSPTGP